MPGQYVPPAFFSPPSFPERPPAWPGGPGAHPAAGPSPQLAGPYVPGPLRLCESAQTLARVPNDVIMTGDLFAVLDELAAQNKGKVPAAELAKQHAEAVRELTAGIRQLVEHLGDHDPGSFVDPQRRALIQQLMRQLIERKLVFQHFLQTVPKDNVPQIQQMVDRQFDQMELPKLLTREGAQSREDLEWKLRAHDSSLERERRIFLERAVAEEWIHEQVKPGKPGEDDDVTHEQMHDWYQAHLKDFDRPARVRWEELMVSFAKYHGNEKAYAAIADLGNQVLFGAALADVARARSDGPTADRGGLRDWTTQGSLICEELDRALFALPPGQLSKIIEGKTGYHIVRVVERQAAHRISFLAVQKEIREKIKQERLHERYRKFITEIQKQFPVWTIFDAAKKPATAVAERDATAK
jgi:hypothetical protein